jgi:hypothetical protein
MREWPARRESHWLATQLETLVAQTYWQMLLQRNYETSHTWDYTWIFSSWLANGLHIIPRVNLVSNIGHGLGGTHTLDVGDPFSNLPTRAMEFPLRHPEPISRNAAMDTWNEENVYSGKDYLPALLRATRAHIHSSRAARTDTHSA